MKTLRIALVCLFPLPAIATEVSRANPIHGLVELSTRTRLKPFHLLADADGQYPTERVVFKDTATGATIWKMSRNPGYTRHQYSNIPVWNLDGSELLLRCARGERAGSWLVAADGSRWRFFHSGYTLWSGRGRSLINVWNRVAGELLEVDIHTGRSTLMWKVPFERGALIPPSADGKKLLLVENAQSRTATTSYAWLINADGSGQPQRFDLGRVVHQTWFLKRPDFSFMFNCEVRAPGGRAEGQFICEPAQGGRIRKISEEHFGHASVSPSGRRVAYFSRAGFMLFDLETKQATPIFERGQKRGGHSTWQCEDRWLICTFGNSLEVVWPDERRSDPLCVPNTQLGYSTYYTEAHPVCSPDGTKVGYASSMLGDCDFYVAVQRRPDPPRAVRLDGHVLTWQPPERAKELAGYGVYHNGQPLNREPIKETRFTVPDPHGRYEVTAVEHSGLESLCPDNLPPPAPTALTAKAIDPYTVKLTWQPSPALDVSYYNVYCGIGNVRVEQARRIASPTVPHTTDWGLRAGTEYHYLVTAVDRQGNESPPSAPARVATPKIEVAQQSLNIGRALENTPLEVEFRVSREDDYVLWLQLRPVNVFNDARMTVSVDRRRIRWEPMWDFVCVGHGGPNPVPFWDMVAGPQRGWPIHRLKAGTHRLTLQLERGQTEVLKLIVTNDRGFVPEGITSFLAQRELPPRR